MGFIEIGHTQSTSVNSIKKAHQVRSGFLDDVIVELLCGFIKVMIGSPVFVLTGLFQGISTFALDCQTLSTWEHNKKELTCRNSLADHFFKKKVSGIPSPMWLHNFMPMLM